MLTTTIWSLINVTLIFFCLHNIKINAINEKKFVGVVQNISVQAVEEEYWPENDNTSTLLKLNVSWLPPNIGRQPSSYSVIITSLLRKDDTNMVICPEETLYYTTYNSSQLNLLLPENKLALDMPEISIHPNCSYKVEILANPRTKPTNKPQEIIYTVPECVGHKCSCINSKSLLPVPLVNVTYKKHNISIEWHINSSNSRVHSYIISIATPLLISKAGLPVYNITKIGDTTANQTKFIWKLNNDNNNKYIILRDGYKILVTATDNRGCLGVEGTYTISLLEINHFSHENITWAILIGIVITCAIFGIFLGILCRNTIKHQFCMEVRDSSRMQSEIAISKSKSRWIDTFLQRHNILYVQQEIEEILYKNEIDEFEISYNDFEITHELGEGQFGKVYLGYLNKQNMLVAIKISQCSGNSNDFEIHQQFMEEVKIMKTVGDHPNLVKLVGYCTSPHKPLCIILEYMQGGDLLAYLHSTRRNQEKAADMNWHSLHYEQKFDTSETLYKKINSHISLQFNDLSFMEKNNAINEFGISNLRYVNIKETKEKYEFCKDTYHYVDREQFIKFALDIVKGMEYLEVKGITHRDLAARNILLTSDLTLKISDFGLSRNGIYTINNIPGTIRRLPIRWMSPEALRDRTFSSKSDVWSFGIVLWEIGTLGAFPYPNISDDKLLRHVIYENQRLEQPKNISHDIYKIMQICWSSQSEDRPSFAQLVLDFDTLNRPFSSEISKNNPCYTILSC